MQYIPEKYVQGGDLDPAGSMMTSGSLPTTRFRCGGGLSSVRSMRATRRESILSSLKRRAMCLKYTEKCEQASEPVPSVEECEQQVRSS